MNYAGGLIVFALGIAMIFFGRARNGVTRPFLRSYVVGVAYTMATMSLLVIGVAWMISGAG